LVAETLGEPDGVLILDGSDVPKRGMHSAGVAAQWCGATGKSGKTDNCQAGVFLGSASRKGYTLLDRRLFLPEAWFDADHATRWQACRIPGEVRLQTKAELGAEMVEQLQARGELPASWLVCDEWFGRHQALLDRMDAAGLWYLAEVPRTTPVWPLREPTAGRRVRARPQAWRPPRAASGKGRRGTPGHARPPAPPQPTRCAGGDGGDGGGSTRTSSLAALPDPGGTPGPACRRLRRPACDRQSEWLPRRPARP
jgi:SRSO17 transposase